MGPNQQFQGFSAQTTLEKTNLYQISNNAGTHSQTGTQPDLRDTPNFAQHRQARQNFTLTTDAIKYSIG